MGARTTRGLPGVYNSVAVVLADGDGAAVALDVSGRQILSTYPSSGRASKGIQTTTITTSTAETTIVTAGATGIFNDIYRLVIGNTSASACNVTIKDATTGTTRFIIAVPAGETRGFSGDIVSAAIQNTAANNWTATCSASVTSIVITAEFIKNT